MKKILITYTVLCICIFSVAQSDNSSHEIQLYNKKAHQYRIGLNVEQNYNKAFEYFEKASSLGSAEATHALGMMYQNGFGCEKNINLAIEFYTQASNQRYARSHYNLGLIFKFGNGVDIDFDRAYDHFSQCAQLGSFSGMYGAGYMLYRGHGCEQNYSEAYSWFIKGAEENHPPCMYYAGLCLRNGYGVEKNTELAKELLIKAAEKGYKLADCELRAPMAENSQTQNMGSLKSANSTSAPQKYRKICRNDKSIEISGVWIGSKVTYDYSGQHVIAQQPIKVQLWQQGGIVTGTWTEDDTLNIALQGTLNNNQLLFEKAQGLRTHRYTRQYLCNIEEGNFEVEQKEGAVFLGGNINEVDTFYKEPRQPVYISLKKENSNHIKQEQQLRLFPNPFSNRTTLEYSVPYKGVVHIELYDMQGKSTGTILHCTMEQGTYQTDFGEGLTAGTYIVKVLIDNKQLYKNLLIVKQP